MPPEKVYVGPFFASFPRNEAHNLFSGATKWGWMGAKEFTLKKVYGLFSFPYSRWEKLSDAYYWT